MHKDLPRRDSSVGGPTETSADTKLDQRLQQAVVSTLAFFALYELPLSSRRVHELLLEQIATLPQVEQALAGLVLDQKVIQAGNLYSVKAWRSSAYQANQAVLAEKWAKIDQYFHWLAVLPFVRSVAVINSLALGTADGDSEERTSCSPRFELASIKSSKAEASSGVISGMSGMTMPPEASRICCA